MIPGMVIARSEFFYVEFLNLCLSASCGALTVPRDRTRTELVLLCGLVPASIALVRLCTGTAR